jgi:tRNA(fMet)-specific endonuclease VapC
MLNDPHGRIAKKVLDGGMDNVCTSIMAAAEMRYGAAKKKSVRLRRQIEELLSEIPVAPFDYPADVEYGKLRAALEASGRILAGNDLLIAAHANAIGATVVTLDSDFRQAEKFVAVKAWR